MHNPVRIAKQNFAKSISASSASFWALLIMIVATPGTWARADEFKLNGHTFTLPAGFTIEQVAGPPVVDRPISGDFDEQGRFYVSDSSGSNEKIQVQLEKRPHRLLRLDDIDGDGHFDKSTVFADKMMFPEGVLWHEGSVYVAAPPEIWKLTDRNDDGFADEREVWFDAKTLTGCANDLHGPYLGQDGWIYWCKGAFAEQTHPQPGRPDLVTKASHIFRRHPDGGPVESVMTGGMDNPVEVVFTPGGERIFSTTFFQHPAGGLRDGLIHAIYGGVYGKEHSVLDNHPRTGGLMPVLTHLGAAAPCGLVRLKSDELGEGYRDSIMTCLFNMHKVTRHVLVPHGASFKTQDEDFLVSDNLDFHPTDIIEDADGSLLVIDTGGWYKLCCPTSQLHKPDILGAVYRIRRTGAHEISDPRGLEINWKEITNPQLAALLGDPRPAVAQRAIEQLGKQGDAAVALLSDLLKTSQNPQQRLNSVWTLTRIDAPTARAAVRAALSDSDETVRQAALHSISLWRDAEAEQSLIAMLGNSSPSNRRAAAEALGRIGSAETVDKLLAAVDETTLQDRALEHSLIYAAIEIGDPAQTRRALAHANPLVHRAALIALDQMPGGGLQAADVVGLLESPETPLRETAWWIAESHPEWAGEMASVFEKAVRRPQTDPEQLTALSGRLERFVKDPGVQAVMATALTDPSIKPEVQAAVLNAMIFSGLKTMPATWSAPLQKHLSATNPALLEKTVKAVSTLSNGKPSAATATQLRNIVNDATLPAQIRLQALVALPAKDRKLDRDLLAFLCENLDIENGISLRSLATDILLSTPLNSEQLQVVADATETTGPMELKRLMELFTKSGAPQVGTRLVNALANSASVSSLSPDELRKQFAVFGGEVLTRSLPLLARIERENQQKYQKLESILGKLDQGDIRRGQKVFHSSKVSCIACHAMGYLGGRVGPDLTRIGGIRSERDLLESVLFPSASFVRSFEPTAIATVDGKVHSGIIINESSTELVLQVDAEKALHIPIDDVDERVEGTVSIMPDGLDKQLTPQQLVDLITFLKASK
ncbi:HEAT repeat protein [Symmachiella dynata]|uniref:HEAT repeat protein n=1 Tax=Symmachiella dynata TaxID=2527995 RepID=A0A517ZQR1_9PLAN|nr:PVC-type heme-binding CxxCH protein [Symmachiella dynata]QDU44826.1 HEAT repeat protein [Symmachiella dynata]